MCSYFPPAERCTSYAAAIIVEIAYGHTVSGLEDEYIEIADRATTETVTAGTPGTSILGLLVDFFPIRAFSGTVFPCIIFMSSS